MHDVIEILGYAAGAVIIVVVLVVTLGDLLWSINGPDRAAGFTVQDAVWTGRFAAMVPLHGLTLSRPSALAVATRAIEEVGGQRVEMVTETTAIGWHCRKLKPMGDRELAVVVRPGPDDTFELLCCARPRFARQMFDYGTCRRLAVRLSAKAAELSGRTGAV